MQANGYIQNIGTAQAHLRFIQTSERQGPGRIVRCQINVPVDSVVREFARLSHVPSRAKGCLATRMRSTNDSFSFLPIGRCQAPDQLKAWCSLQLERMAIRLSIIMPSVTKLDMVWNDEGSSIGSGSEWCQAPRT